MKPNNNFNLTHSLLQTVREVVAQEANMTGKKAMTKKKVTTVMISHGKGGGVKVIPKSQYNPKIHDLADEKEPMAAPVAKVDAKKMDRRKVIAKTIEKKKNGIKLSGKAEFVDVRPKMNETIDGPAEVEQVDEISRGLASRYIDKTKDSSSRKAGRALALKKKWGDKNYGTPEPRVKATEEVSEGYGNDLSRGLSTSSHIKKNTGHKVHFNTKSQMIHTDSNKVITHNADNHSVPELIQHAKNFKEEVEHWSAKVEQVDEISKATLGSYVKKASHDVATKSAATGRYGERSREHTKNAKSGPAHAYWGDTMAARDADKVADKFFKKSWARRQGIAKATDKLTKT